MKFFKRSLTILEYKSFKRGECLVRQFTIFEHKALFSLIFFQFVGPGFQSVYHTHSFNAVSFRLFGDYHEEVLNINTLKSHIVKRSGSFLKVIKRDSCHRVGKTNYLGCFTFVITGPQAPTWKEYNPVSQKWTLFKRGRINVDK